MDTGFPALIPEPIKKDSKHDRATQPPDLIQEDHSSFNGESKGESED